MHTYSRQVTLHTPAVGDGVDFIPETLRGPTGQHGSSSCFRGLSLGGRCPVCIGLLLGLPLPLHQLNSLQDKA